MKRAPLTARTADRHILYQRSVQSPEHDARFLSRWFRRMTGRPLRALREDFCGTAFLACEFVKLHPENRAVGVDLDGLTLRWARQRNLARLTGEQRRRVTLKRADVLHVRRPKVDLIAAMNFSYWVFKTRADLLAYMRNAHRSLVSDGVLMLDVYGGAEAQIEQQERTRHGAFTYVWDQAAFDPLTHEIRCKIHYEFRDGSRMKDAFVYDWRLWTLPELREVLLEAGFSAVDILWEGTNRKTNRGNGVYRKITRGVADRSWIAYAAGRREPQSP